MLGLASLKVNDNSVFTFTENTAREKGGAIYQLSYNVNDYVVSKRRFVQYTGKVTLTMRQVSFYFKGNRAGFSADEESSTNLGHYIFELFASMLYCCLQRKLKHYNETFDCIANFTEENMISSVGSKPVVR